MIGGMETHRLGSIDRATSQTRPLTDAIISTRTAAALNLRLARARNHGIRFVPKHDDHRVAHAAIASNAAATSGFPSGDSAATQELLRPAHPRSIARRPTARQSASCRIFHPQERRQDNGSAEFPD